MRIPWTVACAAVVLAGCSSPAPTQPPAAAKLGALVNEFIRSYHLAETPRR